MARRPSAELGAAQSGPARCGRPAPISSEQASYLFGLTLGNQLHGVGVGSELSVDSITRGVKDGIQGKKSTPADIQQIQQYVHTQMLAAATRNKTGAEEFLASNGKKPGVRTTASGLEYKIDKAGDAKAPAITPADEVTVNYRGTLLDGSEFDSSESHGRPLDVPVGGGIIKGWQEALVMMKPGAKWTLYIPPDLAYGANPRPGIPGNSLADIRHRGFEREAQAGLADAAAAEARRAAAAIASRPPHRRRRGTARNQRVRSRALVRSPIGGSPCSASARSRCTSPGKVASPNRRIIRRMIEPVS